MDAFAELYPFLLLILYVLVRALRGRGQAKAAPQPSVPSPTDDRPAPSETSLDDLTRHLEALMGIADEPVERPAPAREIESEFHSLEMEIDEAASFQHQTHGFGPDNPMSEEVFETRPAFRARAVAPARTYDPHDLKESLASKAPASGPSRSASRWTQRLADPARAREAFVLQTILERPSERKR